jgi:hypothetical protein
MEGLGPIRGSGIIHLVTREVREEGKGWTNFVVLSVKLGYYVQVRADIEKRLQDKEEEFQVTRKNHVKVVEGLQESLEEESKARAELQRTKKKLEADVGELETAMEQANQVGRLS